ncbi:MAG: glycosyltransferase [Fimbriimonadaceae bacterium]|nr:glycosyltransferase [Fimbriimonadaceae bacterium]
MTILQMTNAYGARTGGVRTHLDTVRPLYAARGHRAALLVPGEREAWESDEHGPRITLRGPVLPVNRDYRNIWSRATVLAAVERLQPDVVEILDKWTLPRCARALATRRPVLGFTCERLDQVLPPYVGSGPLQHGLIRRYNRWFARQFGTVVAHSAYSAAELLAAGATNVVRVPLGVDLATFRPAARDAVLRQELLAGAEVLLVFVGRLVPEKQVSLLPAMMQRLGPRYRLVVAGAGPGEALLRAAPGTTLLGFRRSRAEVATLLASADVFVFPSAIEAFALSVLEALASGCRVAAVRGGAVAEVLPPAAGSLCRATAPALAAAVERAAGLAPAGAAAAGRAVASRYRWDTYVDRILALHQAALESR